MTAEDYYLYKSVDFLLFLCYNATDAGQIVLPYILRVVTQKGGSTMSENTCKVILALITFASTCVVVCKEIRLAEIAAAKG